MSDVVREIMARANSDAAFRRLLQQDPDAALAGYALSGAEREELLRLTATGSEASDPGSEDESTDGSWVPGVS